MKWSQDVLLKPYQSTARVILVNSYRVSSPLPSHIPTLQPAVPESLSMMMKIQDKPSDFSLLLVIDYGQDAEVFQINVNAHGSCCEGKTLSSV